MFLLKKYLSTYMSFLPTSKQTELFRVLERKIWLTIINLIKIEEKKLELGYDVHT